jgi:hypothetical protein
MVLVVGCSSSNPPPPQDPPAAPQGAPPGVKIITPVRPGMGPENKVTLSDGSAIAEGQSGDLPNMQVKVDSLINAPIAELVGGNYASLDSEAITLPSGSATLVHVRRPKDPNLELWLIAIRQSPERRDLKLAYFLHGRVTGTEATARTDLLQLAQTWRIPVE